jgi:hypothetical protein
MAMNGYRMLHMGGTTVRDWPNLENTRFTTRENVVEESVVVASFWKIVAVVLLAVGLIASALVETLTCWRAPSRSVQLQWG